MPRYADRKRHLVLKDHKAYCGTSVEGRDYLIFIPKKGMKFRDMVYKHNVCAMCVRSKIAEQLRKLLKRNKEAK